MKLILKLLPCTIFFLISLTSCKKDNGTGSFTSYFKGKIDAVAFECNTNIHANKPQPIAGQAGDPFIRITAGWPGYVIQLDLSESTGIAAVSYVFEAGKTRSGTLFEVQGLVIQGYYAGSNICFGCLNQLPLSGSGKITILEINSWSVKGTFEFITEPVMGSNIIKTVTDGSFYINRDQ